MKINMKELNQKRFYQIIRDGNDQLDIPGHSEAVVKSKNMDWKHGSYSAHDLTSCWHGAE